jgi:hypothetical protein
MRKAKVMLKDSNLGLRLQRGSGMHLGKEMDLPMRMDFLRRLAKGWGLQKRLD